MVLIMINNPRIEASLLADRPTVRNGAKAIYNCRLYKCYFVVQRGWCRKRGLLVKRPRSSTMHKWVANSGVMCAERLRSENFHYQKSPREPLSVHSNGKTCLPNALSHRDRMGFFIGFFCASENWQTSPEKSSGKSPRSGRARHCGGLSPLDCGHGVTPWCSCLTDNVGWKCLKSRFPSRLVIHEINFMQVERNVAGLALQSL